MLEPQEEGAEPVDLSSHEIMMWLADVERSRYVAFQELFECDGWRLFKDFALAKVTEFGVKGANAPTWEANRAALGARLAWEEVSKAAEDFMKSFEQVALQNKEEAQPEQSVGSTE